MIYHGHIGHEYSLSDGQKYGCYENWGRGVEVQGEPIITDKDVYFTTYGERWVIKLSLENQNIEFVHNF